MKLDYHNLMVEIIAFMYNKELSYKNKLGYGYTDIFHYLKDKHPEIEHNTLYWHLTHKIVPYLEKAKIVTRLKNHKPYIFTLERHGL